MKKTLVSLICLVMVVFMFACAAPVPEVVAAPEPEATQVAEPETTEAPPETPKEGIEWRFVSAFTKAAAEHAGFWLFYERINEELDGRLNIKYLGGTEVVAYFDQFEQLGKGAFEIGHIPVNMAENLLPVTDALYLTEYTPMEMRENGTYEYMIGKYAEKMNLQFLGVTSGEGYAYTFYTNFEVNSLDDFKGKTIRTAPIFVPVVEALGAGAVAMPGGEVYTALERGVIDGFGWSTVGAVDNAWYEVVDYRIEPPFFPCNIGIYVNKDAYDALPDDLKAEVNRIAMEVEAEVYAGLIGELVTKESATLEEKGMKTITLTGELADQWLALARDAGWKNLEKLDPVGAEEVRALVTKAD